MPHKKAMEMPTCCDYRVIEVTQSRIVLIDLCTGYSVTNAASYVIDELIRNYGTVPGRRIYYRDTLGQFDELTVESGVFNGFLPCSAQLRAELQQLASEVENVVMG